MFDIYLIFRQNANFSVCNPSVTSVHGKMAPVALKGNSHRFSRNLLSKSKPLTLGFDFVMRCRRATSLYTREALVQRVIRVLRTFLTV